MIMKNSPDKVYHLFKRPDMQPIPAAEERALFEALWRGDLTARAKLIQANSKFAAQVARVYMRRGLPIEDLVNEAILGLSRAVDRFDHDMGYKFISYAVWWIRQGLLQALAEQSRTLKVPTALFGKVKRIDRARQRLEQELSRTPSPAEIAEAAGMSIQDTVDIQRISDNALSLDMPTVGTDGDCTLQEVLPGDEVTDADICAASDRAMVEDLLTELKPREREIIRRVYGLDTDSTYQPTLEEVGQQLGLTRERVRQIKEKALHRLRHPSRLQKLRQ